MADSACPHCGEPYSESYSVGQNAQVIGPSEGRMAVCTSARTEKFYVHELSPSEAEEYDEAVDGIQAAFSAFSESSDHSDMERGEQVLYAMKQEGVGVWVTPFTLCEADHINDPEFRYGTVNSAMHRLDREGEIRRREIDGKYFYSLPDDRAESYPSPDISKRGYELMKTIDHLEPARFNDLNDWQKEVVGYLRKVGMVDARHYGSPDRAVYWLTERGGEELSEYVEQNEWTGGL